MAGLRVLSLVALSPVVLSISSVCSAQPQLSLPAPTPQVGKYEKLEVEIQIDRFYEPTANPFDPDAVDMRLVLKTPGGTRVEVPAFYCRKYERRLDVPGARGTGWMYPQRYPVWLARVAPTETGQYEAWAEVKAPDGTGRSNTVRFTCVPSKRRGFVQVSREDPRYFAFTDGTPFFPIGQNLAFIGESQHVKMSNFEGIFGKLSANGANYLRIWTCCQDWALAIESPRSAWGRSWSGRPPIVPLPAAEGAAPPAKCLKIVGGEKGTLSVMPCQAVALRPNTKYVLRGRVLTTADGKVRISAGQHVLERPVASAKQGDWVPLEFPFTTGANEFWLGPTAIRVEGSGTAWLDELSLTEADGVPELLEEADVNRPPRGYYNQVDSALLDEVVAAAERHGIYLQLCVITRDLYMEALKDDKSPAYQQAIVDARKLLRYAVARWGYSTAVATWEYFNENNPGLPSERFYTALGEYLEQIDTNHHLRQTSEWGPSPRTCRLTKLDVADVHFYLRAIKDPPFPDEVAAAQGQARFLREHAPQKPALIAEFGLANEKWQPTPEMERSESLVDFHNGLWASALSGTSGTAIYWWWDRLDKRNVYPLYRPLADFVAGIPWTTAKLQTTSAAVSDGRLRVVGLQGPQRAYVWLFDQYHASWDSVVIRQQIPPEVRGVWLALRDLQPNTYRIQWWDTWHGKVLHEANAPAVGGVLRLTAPSFSRDVACKIEPAEKP
jgi:hypothetical protein